MVVVDKTGNHAVAIRAADQREHHQGTAKRLMKNPATTSEFPPVTAIGLADRVCRVWVASARS